MENHQTTIKQWLARNKRSASWLGQEIGLGPSQSADIVAGRKHPSLAQRIAIEVISDGAVGRHEWAVT